MIRQGAPGSVFDMEPELDNRAKEKAKKRLRMATTALTDLKEAKSLDDFSDIWLNFLNAFKGIYTTLEKGSKISPQSRQWFGGKATFRRDDELLQYLYQARNDEEHGLEEVVEKVPGSTAIGVPAPGFSNAIRIDGTTGPGGVLRVTSLDGKPVKVAVTKPHVKLIEVQGRGGADERYPPPKVHLGKALENNLPVPVAELAIAYMGTLIDEACALR